MNRHMASVNIMEMILLPGKELKKCEVKYIYIYIFVCIPVIQYIYIYIYIVYIYIYNIYV